MALTVCRNLLFLVIAHSLVHSTVFVLKNDAFNLIVSSFPDAVSQFGPELFHVDGFLSIAYPINACEPIQNVSRYHASGSRTTALEPDVPFIALIGRGGCNFDLKVLNAQNAHFSGAIVFNNVDYEVFPMGGRDFTNEIFIPSVMVDKMAGERLQSYSLLENDKRFIISMTSFYSVPLKYVLLVLLVLVGLSLLILIGCFISHFCNVWRRSRHGRLSRRHLRQLVTKRFAKGQDPYEACPICLEDYEERDKLRLLPCHHAFHTRCVDPWLLRNHRRCPVCNQAVQLPGVQTPDFESGSIDAENVPEHDAIAINYMFRLRHWFISMFARGARLHRTPSGLSANSSSDHSDEEETAPLLAHSTAQATTTAATTGFTVSTNDTVGSAVENAACTSVGSDSDDDDDSLLLTATNVAVTVHSPVKETCLSTDPPISGTVNSYCVPDDTQMLSVTTCSTQIND